MLAHLGVLAYFGWQLSWVGLFVLAPLCWFYPASFALASLSLIASHRLIWWAALSQFDSPGYMPLPWLRVALATLISIPVILIVFLSIRYKYSFKLNIKLGSCAALFAIPVATTLVLTPYWIESVQIKFVESARNFAKGRPYCVIKPVEGGYPVENPSIGELLFRATHDQGEYPTFYAMMIVEADSNVESMYWSFKELSFLKIPPTFGMYRIDKLPCRPVNDPLAAIANPE